MAAANGAKPGPAERPWLKPRALAAQQGISRAQIWRWAEKGLVEVVRQGPATGVRMRLREAAR